MHKMPIRRTSACAAASVAVFMLSSAASVGLGTSSERSSGLDAALDRLQAGDARGAVQLLEHLTQRDPKARGAWPALGRAYQQLHQFDKAIAAFQRSLQLQPDAPRVLYSLGVAYAAQGDRNKAFEWLGRARDSRRYDMTEMTVDEDLKDLRTDARFAALLPRPEDFADPFVEPVKIIREWHGESSEDQFGWIARNAGDVDGDGIPDVVTSAPTHGDAGSNSGRIYLYSTGSGKLLWTADGRPGDQLGTGVEAAGDTNGDGIPDVVASGPAGSGIAYIYSGRDGRVLQRFISANAAESFGSHISGAGDVNRDGFADVIVGAPGKEGENRIPGRAYVYSGKDGTVLLTLEGERVGDEFGSTVAGYSNGHRQFLVVGAPRAGYGRHGRVYVYDGTSRTPTFTIDSDATGAALGGMFVSIPGDMDGDGVSEIYASDWSNSAQGRSSGRIYVHSGSSGRRLFTLTGETPGEGFGTSPSAAGDVDGDGRADLIVGAWQYGGAAVSGGRAYLYSGRTGSLLKTYTCKVPGDTFGFDAVGIGDVDGDGSVDLLITSAWSGIRGHHSGRVFIISSGLSASGAGAGR